MQKIINNSKINSSSLIILVLVISSIITIISCAKDSTQAVYSKSAKETDKQSFLQDSKKSFDIEINKLSNSAKFIGEPDWANHIFSPLDNNNNILIVPLRNYNVDVSFTKSMSPKGFRQLIFSKISSNEIKIEVVELHPDKMEDLYQSGEISKTFTGYLLTYALNNNLVQGHHRTNGKADKLLKVPNTIFENAN